MGHWIFRSHFPSQCTQIDPSFIGISQKCIWFLMPPCTPCIKKFSHWSVHDHRDTVLSEKLVLRWYPTDMWFHITLPTDEIFSCHWEKPNCKPSFGVKSLIWWPSWWYRISTAFHISWVSCDHTLRSLSIKSRASRVRESDVSRSPIALPCLSTIWRIVVSLTNGESAFSILAPC